MIILTTIRTFLTPTIFAFSHNITLPKITNQICVNSDTKQYPNNTKTMP